MESDNMTKTTWEAGQEQEMPNSLQFLHLAHKLKHLERTGWINYNIPKPETVASHQWRMGIMSAFLFDDLNLDMNKCIKMSLCHDIGESIIGDITPKDGVPVETKFNLEFAAINKIAGLVSSKKGDEIRNLFMEFEERKTPEGKFVNGLDKFDMVLQAYEYEQRENKPKSLQQFFDSAKETLMDSHPAIKDLVDKLYTAREANIPFHKIF